VSGPNALDPSRKIAAPGGAVVFWLMAIYLLSGACSLMDEVVWARLLMLTLGNTVYASTVVVSTFMGGLALGALWMGRHADRVRQPLKLYALLEGCATVTAVLIPFALRLADHAYRWTFTTLDPSPAALLGLQVVVSAAILLVPTMLMGSTLPLLSRFVARVEGREGSLVGRLYALNMLGATLGCFLAGFVLIRVIGVIGTLVFAASLNLVVALGGLALSRRAGGAERVEPAPATSPAPASKVLPSDAPPPKRRGVLIAACFASGFVSVGYEIVWMRAIGYRLGVFTYVFTAVLTAYLLGNVLGALWGSRLSKRLREPALGFAFSLALLGVAGALFAPWIVYWYGDGQTHFAALLGPLESDPVLAKLAAPLVHCAVLLVGPSILMGVGFPLAIQTWNRWHPRVGRSTAAVYGANTIGSVSGGAATGLLLIPLLGMQASLNALAVACAGMGALLALSAARGAGRIAKPATVAVALVAVAGTALVPAGLIHRELLVMPGMRTFDIVEGINTTASMREQRSAGEATLWLASGNIVVGGTGDSRTAQKTLGHLGLMLNPGATEVLSVGFGSGETTLCLSKHELDRIDCVEIAPEMVGLAKKHLSRINLGSSLEEHINMVFMDARNFLHLTSRQYDLILNDSNNPQQPGSAPLFAREHFENALAHLKPGGLFITKLHLGEPAAQIESILGTFAEVFPSVSIWFPVTRPYPFLYVAGSAEPQTYSPRAIDAMLADEPVRRSADYLFWRDSRDVLSGYLGDEMDLARALGDYTVNSDLHPFVEFDLAPQGNTIQGGFLGGFVAALGGESIFDHVDWSDMSAAERRAWRTEFAGTRRVAELLVASFLKGQAWGMLLVNHEALKFAPENPALRNQLSWILKAAHSSVTPATAATSLASSDGFLKSKPDFAGAWVIRSWSLAELGRANEALQAAREAVRLAPFCSAARTTLGRLLLGGGDPAAALEQLERAVEQAEDDAKAHYLSGEALRVLGRESEARARYERTLQLDARHPGALARLGLEAP